LVCPPGPGFRRLGRPVRGRPADGRRADARLLDGTPFVFTGPDRWNALGLGTTALFAAPLVYNTKRSGTFDLGGRRYVLRRVAFPTRPTPEWFVVDLFENADRAGASREELAEALGRAVGGGGFDRERLGEMAARYGTKRTQALIRRALQGTTH
jgi:hypothetical protein